MSDDKHDKKGGGSHFASVPIKPHVPVGLPQMPKSFDDTVGAAIFDQERSWLKAERDPDPGYTVITLGIALLQCECHF